MRNVYGTVHLSDTGTAVAINSSVAQPYVLWANLQARAGNGSSMFIGNSSDVNSTNGYELQAGDALNEDYRGLANASVSGARFWVDCVGDTTSELDFSMGLDD